jgi:CBS domain-containing protein
LVSKPAARVGPSTSLVDAARLMRDGNVGMLPVCDGSSLVGVITDRDIAVRGVGAGCNPSTTAVADCMTRGVQTCDEDELIEHVLVQMAEAHVGRVPVTDSGGHLRGVLSIVDVAHAEGLELPVGVALGMIREKG